TSSIVLKAKRGSRMSRRRFILIALLAVVLLAAAVALWLARPRQVTVTLEVTGTKGMAIEGTCDVDGVSHDLTGAVPAQFEFIGHRVIYSLLSKEDSGEFRLKTSADGAAIGSKTSLSPPTHGIRGWVKSNWAWADLGHWIEVFDRDSEDDWEKG